MELFNQYQAAYVRYLELKNKLMRSLKTSGFLTLYKEMSAKIGDPKKAFDYCNSEFNLLVGEPRYPSFQEFIETNFPNPSESDKIQRDYLLILFKEKGFSTWESFSPLVLHYYPQVTASRLRDFYDGKIIDKEVIRYVDFVRQIIG